MDYDVLRQMGLEVEVRTLLTGVGLSRLTDVLEDAYYELTMEFLSTFRVERESPRAARSKLVSFRLGG